VRQQSNRPPEGKRQRQIPRRKMLTLSDSNNFGPFSIQVKAKGSAWASSGRLGPVGLYDDSPGRRIQSYLVRPHREELTSRLLVNAARDIGSYCLIPGPLFQHRLRRIRNGYK